MAEIQTVDKHWCVEAERMACGHTVSTKWLIGREPFGPSDGPLFCGSCQDWQPVVAYSVEWL